MHGAIVELDALADADRSGADHDSLLSGQWFGLVLLLIGAVEIWCPGLKLRSAGVDHLVHRTQVPGLPELPGLLYGPIRKCRDACVRKAEPLGLPHQILIEDS